MTGNRYLAPIPPVENTRLHKPSNHKPAFATAPAAEWIHPIRGGPMCPPNRPVDNTEKWPETWLGLQMAYDLWRARA